ncbi:hypothetical protein BT63DRAFT_422204 [Microthyrium microscopicum]|uniref:protein-ribulosamine 3-kinase n=1 Tax=Microthyrium microscopicum TaxID=703497 RepID=A0A6A6UIP0_9PEZI|nr:hypothetical protein BT63DRAFT_422204 [Microthyrium microscopicum]
MSSSIVMEAPEIVEQWKPPTESLGRVPLVTPGKSGDKPIEGDFPLDQVVIDQLPPGTVVHSCNRYGASAWTVTARIETTTADGEEQFFFVKCADADQGKAMLEGEFNSMRELYNTAPNFIPKPHTWGKLNVSNPDTYFFLCQFIEMTNDNPDPTQLCIKMVELHRNSVSPTGQFGFHINTCQGNLPQQTSWSPTWTGFFSQMLRGAMALNIKYNGKWKDLEECVERLIKDVIPQLIAPLESDGRSVKPSLIHGDLWEGNVGTSFETGEIYTFDASVYYGHNEIEVAIWRARFNKILGAKVYLNTYLARMGISEPVEQFDDRHRIYSVYHTLHESACHNGSSFREECYENIKFLLEKYPPVTTAGDTAAGAS